LERLIRVGGIFIVDTKHWQKIPIGTLPVKRKQAEHEGVILEWEVKDSFAGKRRARSLSYSINGEVIQDTIEMDILTEADLVALLESFGFRERAIFFDFRSERLETTDRFQIVFEKL
jgi:hypothetical protein